MPLTNSELVTCVEITQEILEALESLDLTDEQVTAIQADITTWNENKNDTDVEMRGEVNYRARWLLTDIRQRVRKQFGFLLISPEESGYSVSVPTQWIY